MPNKWSIKRPEENVDSASSSLTTTTLWTSSCNSLATRSTATVLTLRKPSAETNSTKWAVVVVVVVDSAEEDKLPGEEIKDLEEDLEVDSAEATEVGMDMEVEPTTGEEITPGKEVVEAGVIKEVTTGVEVAAGAVVT